MAYSDFDLKKAKQDLGVNLIETPNLFATIASISVPVALQDMMVENIPLARAINTEKARSELLIAPILVAIRKLMGHQISLFSGVEFNVDKEKGLNGFCDFILSASAEQLLLSSPIVTVVEAKNENIIGGLGQCIAAMVAAQLFNQAETQPRETIYGVVTTGTMWKFLKITGQDVSIDLDDYPIEALNKILGILSVMVAQKA